jgi:hypothetical protein
MAKKNTVHIDESFQEGDIVEQFPLTNLPIEEKF